MWFLLALSSAALASLRKINDKHLSQTVSHLHLAWLLKAATLPILLLLAIATNNLWPHTSLSVGFWIPFILATMVATPLDTAVYLQSLKHGQLSKTAPLMSLWPVCMLITGAIFLGQIPTLLAVGAVAVIVVGVYILNTSRGNRAVLRNILRDRGTRFGLIGVVTVTLNATLSAVCVQHMPAISFAFWSNLSSMIIQATIATVIARRQPHNVPLKLILQNGTIQGLAGALYYGAVASGPIGYVVAVRSTSATMSALLGAKVFKEPLTIRMLIALALITIGALLLGTQA